MKLEREIYNLLLRKLTYDWQMASQYREANAGRYFTWKTVLTEDIECNAAKSILTDLITKINNYWIPILTPPINVPYNEITHKKYCIRFTELLKLAEFHSTLIHNNEIVEKLNTIINTMKEKNVWKVRVGSTMGVKPSRLVVGH